MGHTAGAVGAGQQKAGAGAALGKEPLLASPGDGPGQEDAPQFRYLRFSVVKEEPVAPLADPAQGSAAALKSKTIFAA